jgi:hypothetical protein
LPRSASCVAIPGMPGVTTRCPEPLFRNVP